MTAALPSVSIVNGNTDATIASILLTAGSAEGVDLNTIVLQMYDKATPGEPADLEGLGDGFSAVSVWYGDRQLGATYNNPSSSDETASFNFSISPALSINAGQTVALTVKGVTKTNAAYPGSGTTTDYWVDGNCIQMTTSTSGTGKTTGSSITLASDVNAQQIVISAKGTLTVTADAGRPNKALLSMGASGQTIGIWRFAANAVEDINVTKIQMQEVNADDTPGNVVNLKLYVDGAQIGDTAIGLIDTTTNYTNFGNGTTTMFTVPAGGYKLVTLKTDVNSPLAGTTDKGLTFRVVHPATISATSTIVALGAGSGQYATASGDGNLDAYEMLVYKTQPTFTVNASSPDGAGTPANKDEVLRFNVTADSGESVYLDMLTFQITSTDNKSTPSRWNECDTDEGTTYLDDADFDLFDASDMSTALDTSDTDWSIYKATGAICDGTTADVGFIRVNLPTNKEITAGNYKTFVLKINTIGASAADDDAIQVTIPGEPIVSTYLAVVGTAAVDDTYVAGATSLVVDNGSGADITGGSIDAGDLIKVGTEVFLVTAVDDAAPTANESTLTVVPGTLGSTQAGHAIDAAVTLLPASVIWDDNAISGNMITGYRVSPLPLEGGTINY